MRSDYIQKEDILYFNNFIEESKLIDLPLNDRDFTWCRLDGTIMSRLEAYLIIFYEWPNYLQWVLDIGLSDNFSLFLYNDYGNWLK